MWITTPTLVNIHGYACIHIQTRHVIRKMHPLQVLCLFDTLIAMIDNVLLTLFKIFKQDGSLLTCILYYHVNSSHISVMLEHFVPLKLN